MSTYTVTPLALPGVLLVTPKVFVDPRGYSVETYQVEEFEALGIGSGFVQDYLSHSHKGVIRGLHLQRTPYAQDKLVRCAYGEIFDVAADIDPASPTFGTYVSARLKSDEQNMLYVPGNYAHGFCVVSDSATVEYKTRGAYKPEFAVGVAWNDPRLNIAWPTQAPILSEKDVALKPLP
jgi:dTDP-4-dehydrorhamnose 3,5-epimerase